MNNFNAGSRVHDRRPSPLNTLYVAAPARGTPTKIGYAADVDKRVAEISSDLRMDFEVMWTYPHPAASEIEARVKTVLSDLCCDPNDVERYAGELFELRPDIVIAVAQSEIDRFAADLQPAHQKSDTLAFRVSSSVGEQLADRAAERGQSVSSLLRERVRAYLEGDLTLPSHPESGTTGDGAMPAVTCHDSNRASRLDRMLTFRLPLRLARRLRARAGSEGVPYAELLRRLALHDGSPSSDP